MRDRRIYKYKLQPHLRNIINMPKGSILRFIDEQDGDVYVWAEVEPDAGTVKRKLLVIPTGFQSIPKGTVYIGSCQVRAEGLVWHVYEDVTL